MYIKQRIYIQKSFAERFKSLSTHYYVYFLGKPSGSIKTILPSDPKHFIILYHCGAITDAGTCL